jgi:hypothetical protein
VLDETGFTVNIRIIDSTFNKPGGKYYVLIDNGFVKNKNYQEPIIGIQNSGWSFITSNCFINFSYFERKRRKNTIYTKMTFFLKIIISFL